VTSCIILLNLQYDDDDDVDKQSHSMLSTISTATMVLTCLCFDENGQSFEKGL